MEKKLHAIFILATLSLGIIPQVSTNVITPQVAPTSLMLGGLFPLTGALSSGGVEREAAFRMAIEQINADPNILPNTTLNFAVRDTGTTPAIGAIAAEELISLGIFGLVGAASSAVSKAVAPVAEAAKKPQISYSSTNPDLSNKTTYPYFLRVVSPDPLQGLALANILFDLNVSSVATLSSSDPFGTATIAKFNETFLSLGGNIETSQQFTQGTTDVTPQLQAIKDSNATIIVANMLIPDAQTVFSQAASLGITKANGYQWVGSDAMTQDNVYTGNNVIRGAMEGMIGTVPNRGEGPLYESFLDKWESCNGQTPAIYAGCGDRTPNPFAAYAYDAVYAFAIASDALIKAGIDPINGTLLLNELKTTSFDGVTGTVSFDVNQDRNGVYNLLNHNGTLFVNVGIWDRESGIRLTTPLHWAGPSFYLIPTQLTLGGLFPLTGRLSGGGVEREAAARMAIHQINNDPNILNNTLLNLLVKDTQTDPTTGANVAQELLDLDVIGLVGAASSFVSIPIAEKAEIYKTPQISYSSSHPDLSNKALYPYFLRVLPNEFAESIALANILWDLNVTTVGIIYNPEVSIFGDRMAAFEIAYTTVGGSVTTLQPITANGLDFSSQLSSVKVTGTKTILVDTSDLQAKEIFSQAENFDMTINQDYQWVGLSNVAFNYNDAGIMEKIQGMISASYNRGEGALFESFLDLWESCNGQSQAQYAGCGDRMPNTYATFAYDAVYAFALAADATIKAGLDPNDGDTLLQELQISDFDGLTGRIKFDVNGDRLTYYNIFNHNGAGFVDIGDWSNDNGVVLTQPVSWSSEFKYAIPITTTVSSGTVTDISQSTSTKSEGTSSAESEDPPDITLPFNSLWGIVGMIVLSVLRQLNNKKRKKN